MDVNEEREEGAAFDADPAFAAFQIKPPAAARSADYPGAHVLGAGNPTQVHTLLWEGDPLGVTQICLDRLEERAILLDPVRVLRASMARVAHDAYDYAGDPELKTWLERCVDKAVLLVISNATDAELRGDPIEQGEVPLAAAFAGPLGIEKALVRRAMLHFQSLPLQVRRTFCAIMVRGQNLEAWSAAGNGSVGALEEHLILAVNTMVSTDIPEAPRALDEQEPDVESRKDRRKQERQKRKDGRKQRGGSHD